VSLPFSLSFFFLHDLSSLSRSSSSRSRALCYQSPRLSLCGTTVQTIPRHLVLSSLVSPPPRSGRHHHFRSNIHSYSGAVQWESTRVAGPDKARQDKKNEEVMTQYFITTQGQVSGFEKRLRGVVRVLGTKSGSSESSLIYMRFCYTCEGA